MAFPDLSILRKEIPGEASLEFQLHSKEISALGAFLCSCRQSGRNLDGKGRGTEQHYDQINQSATLPTVSVQQRFKAQGMVTSNIYKLRNSNSLQFIQTPPLLLELHYNRLARE